MIRVRDLSVSFGRVPALRDVRLTVDPGEVVGLVGPNGAGKSTLLGAIDGLVDPTEGVVEVDGDSVVELPARALARRVAMVPQETTLSFAFPVREVVAMGRTPYRSRFERASPVDRAHTQRAMERTGVARFADRTIDEVSGGERQRVVLARALCQDAPALLLDEPTSSLDINHASRILSLVRDLAAAGRAALCAIHDLSLAARFCDRLVLLAGGEILAAGPPEAVLTEARVERAFDTGVAVTRHPATGAVDVTALTDRPQRTARVHVLGGGRNAARAIAALAEAGFRLSAGVLPRGDVATETATAHDVETVTAAPFAPIPPGTRNRANDLLRRADVAVLAGDDEVNERLARRAERVVALDDVELDGGETVGVGDVVAGVERALAADRSMPLAGE